MRAISIGLILLHLSACAGTPPGRDAGPPPANPGPCDPSGSAATRSGGDGVQASNGSLTIALTTVFLLLGLVGAIAGCPKAGARGGG